MFLVWQNSWSLQKLSFTFYFLVTSIFVSFNYYHFCANKNERERERERDRERERERGKDRERRILQLSVLTDDIAVF